MNVDILKAKNTQLVLVSVASLAAGGAAVHLYSVKKLEAKYADLADREIREAKRFYAQYAEASKKPATPAQALAELHPELDDAVEALGDYSSAATQDDLGSVSVETIRETVVVKSNIFENQDEDDFDLVAEMEKRDPSTPYLITEGEWDAGEPGYDQIKLTYYDGDGVLADDMDEAIDNLNSVIGEHNLGRFGDGTDDPERNTMFIRNEKLGSDFEVVRSDGKYTEEVLGLRHSDDDYRPRVRKFRNQDE